MTVTEDRTGAASAKAATLIEALPWLNRFHGRTVVIKYGGHAMAEEELRLAFAQDLVFLRYAGLRPVVVHGGGPQITEQLDRLGVESAFTAGLRVTTPETMEVVRMVLSGKVNKDIVGLINRHGPFAVGMSGEDASTFTAIRKTAIVDGEPVDIGLVGEIVATNPGAIEALLADGRIPVVSSVAAGRDGEVYNVNADTAAAALAVALDAAKLVVLTDVAGLYRDWPSSAEVISELTAAELERLLPGLSAGMIPKMEACLTAVRGGVPQAHVLDGRLSHAVLLEIFTDSGIGTMVLPEAKDERARSPQRSETEALQKRFAAALMPNYGVPPVAISRGQGCRVWDADGRRYLDLIAGIAVSSLGHAHPAIVEAVSRQVAAGGAHLQPVPARARGRAGRAACSRGRPPRTPAHGGAAPRTPGEGLLRELGHRGQRGGDQAGAPYRRTGAAGDRGRRAQLPRPDHGRAGADRQGVHPRAVRPVRPDRAVRSLRGRRGAARGGWRRCRGRLPRARPGRERRGAGPRGLPARRARGLRPSRRAACAR